MNDKIYPVSETIKYSDGSEKVVNFNLPEEEITTDEIDAEIAEEAQIAEETIETPNEELPDPMGNGIPKEAEEAPSESKSE